MRFLRIVVPLIALAILTACGGGGGGSTPPPPPAALDSWDQMNWDEGEWI